MWINKIFLKKCKINKKTTNIKKMFMKYPSQQSISFKEICNTIDYK